MDVSNEEKRLSAGDESQLIALLRPLLSALATLVEELRNTNAVHASTMMDQVQQNQQQLRFLEALVAQMMERDEEDQDDEDEGTYTDLEGNPIKVS